VPIHFLAKTRGRPDRECHAAISSPLPLTRPPLRTESPTSSDTAPPLSSGLLGGPLNAIWVIVLRCVLDSTLDVQPLSPAFEAFLRDSINLDIMIGKSLFRRTVSAGERWGTSMGSYTTFPLGAVRWDFRPRSFVCMCAINLQVRENFKRWLSQLVTNRLDHHKNAQAHPCN